MDLLYSSKRLTARMCNILSRSKTYSLPIGFRHATSLFSKPNAIKREICSLPPQQWGKTPCFMATLSNEKKLKLYSHWRSSCSHRARIALNLKGIDYEYIPVNLVKGEQLSPEFKKINPLGYVPVLVDGDIVISDSFAIAMYLEEKYPERPLMPRDLQKRAINYQAANIVSSSMQPLQNLGVLKYIEEKVNANEKDAWVKFHIEKGFAALEMLLVKYAGKYATGDEVFLADVFLAPQIYGAINRFRIDMGPFPMLAKLNEAYKEVPAFLDALPEKQPDASSSSS